MEPESGLLLRAQHVGEPSKAGRYDIKDDSTAVGQLALEWRQEFQESLRGRAMAYGGRGMSELGERSQPCDVGPGFRKISSPLLVQANNSLLKLTHFAICGHQARLEGLNVGEIVSGGFEQPNEFSDPSQVQQNEE